MSILQVKREIAPLKKIMLHRPGNELLYLTPGNLHELLFDDIPDLPVAQKEHDTFAQTLRDNGIETLYIEDLVASALDTSNEVKDKFVKQYVEECGVTNSEYKLAIYDYLINIDDNKDLVKRSIEGINAKDLKCISPSEFEMLDADSEMIVKSLPNLYFSRDNFTVMGEDGVALYTMYSQTRNRENIYGEYIFNYHPDYAGKVNVYYGRNNKYHIEGGDVLILNENSLAIGISQRTELEAIKILAKELFVKSEFKNILAFTIPIRRTCMHLDTAFTQIDTNVFTIYPGILDQLKIYKMIDSGDEVIAEEVNKSLEEVLCETLEVDDVKLIKCGGDSRIASEREQWNDGSNTLCIAPGVIVVYERNRITNELLRKEGLNVITIPSSELSRGRGGPRCMSMPFWREEI